MEIIDELKFVPVENGTELTSLEGKCPKCDFNFDAGDVRDVLRVELAKRIVQFGLDKELTEEDLDEACALYGWTKETPVHFSHILGIDIEGAEDGLILHQCPECSTTWDRFTGREGTYMPNTPTIEDAVILDEEVTESNETSTDAEN
jgi:hypothetical protein